VADVAGGAVRCERCGARVHADAHAGSCPRDCHGTILPPGAWWDLAEIMAGMFTFTVLVLAAALAVAQ
jgi:hypothetical protein